MRVDAPECARPGPHLLEGAPAGICAAKLQGRRDIIRAVRIHVAACLATLAFSRAPASALAAPDGATTLAELSVERQDGARDCPDSAALRAAVDRILARPSVPPAPPLAGVLRAEVVFTRMAPGGYQSSVQLTGAKSGERTFSDSGPTCAPLGEAVALTLALLLDPARAPPQAPPVAASAPARPPAPNRKSSAFVLATAGTALGLVAGPSIAGGPELQLNFLRHWGVQTGGLFVLPRSTAFADGTVRVGLLAGHVRVCGFLNDVAATIRAGVCAVGALGLMRGEGRGFPTSNTADDSWLAAGGGIQLSRLFGARVLLGIGMDLLAPLRQQTFSVSNRGIAYRSTAVAATMQFKVGIKLW